MDSNNDADNFWIANENMFITPLVGVLRDVRDFVKRSGELVVLDFSSFPIGFYKHPEVYSSLYHLLRQELGEVAYNPSATMEVQCAHRYVEELLQAGMRVVILFPKQELPHPENGKVTV